MPGPFEGLRVVEFGRFIAAPYCAQLLADGGAEVIKVEPLTGDETRRNGEVIPGEGRQFLNKNRGKRSIAVDLSSSDVLAVIQKLAAGADVVVANFRPGQAERLGIDYETLSGRNPRLIYAENTAYGRLGTKASDPGMDLIMVAYSGLAPSSPDGPVDVENPVIDYMAAMLLSWGVSTALYHRERTGLGQRVDVSLLQAALVLQNNLVNHIDVLDDAWRPQYLEEATAALSEGSTWGEIVDLRTQMLPHAINRSYYGFFRTADGFIAVAAPGTRNQQRVLDLLEVKDRWVTERGWLPDDAHEHVRQVHEAVAKRFAAEKTEHWLNALHAAGVPVAPARLRDELLNDEQALANGYFIRLQHDLVGGVTVVAPPVKFSAAPLEARAASPVLGRDTAAILEESGLSQHDIEALIAAGSVFVAD